MKRAILLCTILICCSVSGFFYSNESELFNSPDSQNNSSGNPATWVLTPTSGSHFGGENLTLTGSDFSSFFPEVDPWENFTLDSSANVGLYSSIAVDSNDEHHISYQDATNGHLKYASNAGGTWTDYPIDNGGGYIGRYTSIDIDSNDKVHISYGNLNSWDLKYATNVAGSWSRTIIDDGGSNGQAGMYSSLEIDSNDVIHVSYWGRNMDLKHATKSAVGGTWSDYTVDWGSITGEWTSIALDSNNKPWISYVSETWDRLELASKTGTSWTDEIVDSGGSGQIDNGTSIAIDSNDA